ncbi:MAG TPA: FtsX-like permease family protein, partial [Thermomicrobiales bacterium]|nr:FtsX-like permease family protein [Thermomicrobiales bacterium]
VVALELALGLLVPLLAALVPVLRGTRITVREAVTSYGLSGNDRPGGLLDRLLAGLRGFARPVLLSLRNTFRRRGRLALTLATLTIGGALFASVTTIQSSLDGTFDEMMDYWNYDVQVNLDEWASAEMAVQAVEAQPGVTAAEGWIATNASYLRPDGSQNSNVWFTAGPADTALIQPTLVEGRWLLPDEGQALVVNVDIANDEGISVGDIVSLAVEGQTLRWPVVGISTSQLIGPAVYAPYQPFSEAVGLTGMANRIIMQTERHDVAAQEDVARLAEDGLRAAGVPVAQVDIVREMRGGTESVFSMLVVLLLVISILLVIVGSIGLTGAMSLNVIERTREIGVMRAIGATNGAIARILIVEGLTVGLLSWLLGAILAIPLSWGLAYALGVALVQSPLVFTFSYLGLGLWLVVVVVLSVVASILPARRAWRLSIREVLAYE